MDERTKSEFKKLYQLLKCKANCSVLSSLTFSNGLTRTTNNITLGGSLTEDTSVATDDNDLLFTEIASGIEFGIAVNSLTGNRGFLSRTVDGDNFYTIINDGATGTDHFTGFGSLNLVTGQGSSIFAVYDAGSSEHGVIINWDSATPAESTRFTSNSDGIRFLNQTTLDVFFQVDITGNVVQPQIGTYLNDAAAAIGNVPINGFYRETATGYVKARVS